jgi:hypothetical protein
VSTIVDLSFPLKLARGLNSREHHMARARRVKYERDVVAREAGLELRGPGVALLMRGEHLVVTLTRLYGARCRDYDDDGLAGSLKGVRDEVAAILGVDDRDPRVAWRYVQRRSDNGVNYVGIQMGRLQPGACPTCGQPKPTAHARLGPAEYPVRFVEPPVEIPDGTVERAMKRTLGESAIPGTGSYRRLIRALATPASYPPKKGGR